MPEPQAPEGAQPGAQEVHLSPADLARSWLGFQGADVEQRIKFEEASRKFNRTYQPTPPGPRPHPEAGGMDHSDWRVAQLEYMQDMRRRRDEDAEDRLDALYDERMGIEEAMEAVDEGDPQKIATYSRLEEERRAKLEEARKRKEEQARAREFDGAAETQTRLNEVTSAIRKMPKDKSGFSLKASGWEVVHYPEDQPGEEMNPEQFQFRYTPDQNERGKYAFIRMYATEGDRYQLRVEDFRNAEEIDDARGRHGKAKTGRRTSFTLQSGKVFHPAAADVVSRIENNYDHVIERRPSSPDIQFGQEHFDQVKGLVENLANVVRTAPSPQS